VFHLGAQSRLRDRSCQGLEVTVSSCCPCLAKDAISAPLGPSVPDITTEGSHFGQSSFTLGKSVLTVHSYLTVLLVFRNVLPEDTFHDFPRGQSETE